MNGKKGGKNSEDHCISHFSDSYPAQHKDTELISELSETLPENYDEKTTRSSVKKDSNLVFLAPANKSLALAPNSLRPSH